MQPELIDRYPLTPLQRGMLFHALAAPGSTVYVEQHRYSLEGDLDLAAFRAAWQAVCERHPVLRTEFDWREPERPEQAVRSVVELPLVVQDWRGRSGPEQAAQLAQWEATERERGFDLSAAPLFRLWLARLGEREWQLVWTYHHLILDGASAGIVLHEFATCYTAAQRGEPVDLPPAPAYRDFVTAAGSHDLAAAQAYWTGALAGFTEPTALGITRPAGSPDAPGERVSHPLPRELTERLAGFARRHGVTVETLLTGAWAVVLGHYSGADDVVFGLTRPGRGSRLPELDRMVGLLINTLPARVRLHWHRPVGQWLVELQREQAQAGGYEFTPLDRVQADSEVPAGRRLFDSIVVVEDFTFDHTAPQRLGDLQLIGSASSQRTNYPLALLAYPREQLVLQALFDAGLVDARLVPQLLRHLATVLEGLLTAAVLGDVALMPPAERSELAGRGTPRAAFPCRETDLLPARFADRARREPDRIAVSHGGDHLPYGELLVRVARLANRLRGLGVGPGVLVGICLPRGVDLVVAVLAVACAGGAYLPVDRRDPAARLRTILSDASAGVLLTDREVTRQLGPVDAEPVDAEPVDEPTSGHLPPTVHLDDPAERELLASLPATLPPVQHDAHDLAYVIYTSGSTGAPKGVMVEHAQLARLFDATAAWFGFGPDDVWTLFHSIAFDFSVWELWGALANGGRLVVVPDELTRDPARFRQLLLDEGVTILNQTPSAFRALLHADLAATGSRSGYQLRSVVLGGEMLEVTSLAPWLERYGDQQPALVNMYGITETTVHVTYRPIRHSDLAAGVPSPIGDPIADLAVRLVDPRGRLVPVGVPGEIYVGGAGVARGYLHRPELTSARFVDPPAGADPGSQRWYRTGDRARWLPDGGLEFLGRVDDQVKIRGYRIELGEIESALRSHPQVSEAAVVARATDADSGHRQLIAYVVPAPPADSTDDGPGLPSSQLRSWLAQRLPDYLVPAGFISLDRLPLTPNGKVDRSALPATGPARPDEVDLVAPRTEVERVLAEVWAEVLGVERLGTADNFFALGGDSILTIQAVSRANRRGISITPAQLFAHQTIAELARVAVTTGAAGGAEQGEVTGDVPPTPVQAWFWELDLPHAGHWNLPVLLAASRPVRLEWLTEALAALVAHHDLLRLRVAAGGPRRGRQYLAPVAEHGPVPVREFDLSALEAHQFGARIDELARQLQAGFDLEREPLLRAAVFRAPAGELDRVLLVPHHLVADAVSLRILIEDLDTACRQLAEDRPIELPRKTTDFPQWARQLAQRAATSEVAEQAGWWLANLPPQAPPLPVDGDPASPNLEADLEVVETALDEAMTSQLLTPAQQAYRTRPDELLLAALVRAMTRWTGVPQLLVDVEGHGRDTATGELDLSRTVGWFTTLAPAWLDCSGVDERDPQELIKAVKEQLRATPGRREAYGLARWLREDELARRLSGLPRPAVSFNYLGRLDLGGPDGSWFTLAPEQLDAAHHPANPRPYLLDVVVGVQQGRLRLYLAYSSRLHERATIERLADAYLDALRTIIDHCVSPGTGGPTPSDFPLARVEARQLDRLAAGYGPIADLYPLSPLQQGLLFHTLANPGSGVYFEQFSMRLDGDLDVDAFERAWSAVIERHPVLRAGIAWSGLAAPHLVVRERVELPLRHHDWRELAGTQPAAELERLLSDDRIQGFDLTRAPLTRLQLIRLDGQSWQLVWSHHHILLDGWSVSLLIQEIFDNYEALRTGRYLPSPPPPSYRDYLDHLASLDFSEAWPYWRRVLSGVTEPTPLGADRPAVSTGRRDTDYARVHRRLAAAESAAVREFARAHRLTLDTVLHGAWALLLAHRSGQDDVVFGVTSAGRPPALAGVEQMVGLFVNTLPARVWVSRDQPVVSWLSGLLRDQVQAREFEHTPLDQVRSWSSVPAGRPLFDSIRGLENYPVDGSRFRTGSITVSDIRTFEQTNYALSFVVIPDDALMTQVWYDALRFTPKTAERVLATVQALILALVADPDRPVGEVLAAVAARYGQPGPPQVGLAPLPQLVEAWAAHDPQRTAVTGDGARLTYRELDERANQLADRLRELGAGPGTPVGTALPGVDRVVAMLAIMKTGAVWVPLPAGEPAAWQRHPLSLCLVAPGQHRGGAPEPVPVEVYDSGSLDGRPAGSPGIPIGLADPATLVWWEAPDGTLAATTLTHGELARRVHARRDDITGIDVVGQLADPGSEPAAWEIWVALGNGAGLALPPVDCPPGAAARWRRLRQEQPVTVVTMAAGDLPELLDRDPRALAGVRRLLLRGELPIAYARRLRTTHRSVTVLPAADLEAGRIAHQLRELPMVREAVLLPTSDGRRLAAYLLPDLGAAERDSSSGSGSGSGSGDQLAERHVAQWRTLYDRTYAGSDPADPTFNIVGWNSSYTGRALGEEAMAEWRAGTIARIRDLRPARVLEIGCGTGLLLFGLLADCDRYVGTDFSAVCLAQLRQHLGGRDTATRAKVTLLERTADDLHGLEPGSFDVVILNSVVQYFPGSAYLDRVLAAAIRLAAPTGAIFVGDLRHHGLREAFHTSVELHRAVDMLPTAQLYPRVTRALEQERELLVDPGYFAALAGRRPEIAAIEVMPRRGKHDTELTRYRFDAILRLGTPPPEPADVQWYDWRRDVLSRSEIGWLLENADGDAVGITGVPNARVAADVEAARLLTDLDGPGTAGELRLAAGKAPAGVDPEELYEIGDRLGWTVAVSWATHRADGGLNALFRRGSDRIAGIGALHAAGSGPGRERVRDAGAPLTNTPLRSWLVGELEEQAWRALSETLPDYAGVSRVLVMDEFPRTADGRVDEAALPALADDEDAEPVAAGALPPRTADELRLARIWERALGLRSVDVRASFFELGGDSLLAIRVIDEATRALGREVPMAVLLQEPTIEAMAAALRAEPADWSPLVEVTPGDGTPFFCVHPAGGGVLCYAELARMLAPQPFCALQARGFDRDDPPYDDLAAMAERYLLDVRARQPRGPYLLGGWSMGGLVAYEMAQQLLAAGEQVELLVLIDTPTPDRLDGLPDESAVLVRLLESVVPLDPAQLRSLPAADRLRHVMAEAERLQAMPPGLDVERASHLFQVYATHLDAVRRYRLRPYGGRVCQLRATHTEPASAEFGWQEFLTGQFDVVEVPGTHETVLWPPHVQQLAERLRAQLAAARPPQRRA